MSAEYTDEELQSLPQTAKVFDAPNINLDDHQLIQEGYMVSDVCASHPTVSFGIASGMTLIKQGGHYKLVPELR